MLISKKPKRIGLSKSTITDPNRKYLNVHNLKGRKRILSRGWYSFSFLLLTILLGFGTTQVWAYTQNFFGNKTEQTVEISSDLKVAVSEVPTSPDVENADTSGLPQNIPLPETPKPQAAKVEPKTVVEEKPKLQVTPKSKSSSSSTKSTNTKTITTEAGATSKGSSSSSVKVCKNGDVQQTNATYYDPDLNGVPTAYGDIYNKNLLTAAHPWLPNGTIVNVKRLSDGKTVQVKINDKSSINLDLSEAAMKSIDSNYLIDGKIKVEYTILSCGS